MIKKIINISLILIFTMTFVACEKERIMPVSLENQIDFESLDCGDNFDYDDSSLRSSGGDTHGDDIVIDSVTDPDEDEDFDGEDKVTDPDEDEDFDGEDKNGENN